MDQYVATRPLQVEPLHAFTPEVRDLVHEKTRRMHENWNAIAPKRIAGIRYEADAVMVLHPTKGWRRISHKRLGIV